MAPFPDSPVLVSGHVDMLPSEQPLPKTLQAEISLGGGTWLLL